MSKFTNKVASVILTVTTAATLSGFGSFVAVAGAVTTAELQAQIATLLSQIAALQAQLGTGTGVSTSACTFTRDLTVGSRGDDVTCLQNSLIGAGHATFTATGYFGNLTKAAVAKWQAANGVAPAAGYFGPKSRAAFAAMGTSTTTTTTTTGTTVIPGATLQVGLGSGSAAAAIAGAGQINTGRFTFTAPVTAGATITGLTFTKVGVVSDSNISNLYLADATTGEVLAQYQSLTSGVGTFSGLNIMVNAGTTWTGELRMDLSSSAAAGNTIAWSLTAVATTATVSGLPVTTAVLSVTTVSNPAIATLALTANAVGSTVDAGTTGVLVSSWTAAVTNSKVKLTNMQFTFVGSASAADIKNLMLKVNGTTVATLASASTNTNFNFPTGIELNTGNSTIEIFADVLGSPNRTMTFSLLQPYRVTAIDTQYNTGLTVTITSTNQTTITINTGSITVTVASDSPTQPIPTGASGVTLAKFVIYAAGEAVKVQFMDLTITEAGSSAWTTIGNVTDDVSNVRLIDDVGSQMGNTITTVASGTSSGQCTLAATTITCHFGTSGSPINYTVPANTARTISAVVDIGSAADTTSLAASLPAMTSNLQGQTSFQTASSGAANGSTLTVTSAPLTIAANTAFSGPTYVAGMVEAKIASFVITAGSAQGASIANLTIDRDANSGLNLQNLKLKVDDVQFGVTRATVGATETGISFSSPTPIIIAAGTSVVVDIYVDILATSTDSSYTSVIDLTGWSATGSISNSALTFPGAVSGQTITLSSTSTLTIARASNSPKAGKVVMSSKDNTLFIARFSNDNVDDVWITDVTITDTITNGSTGIASFENVQLYDENNELVAGPLSMTMPGSATSTIAFSLYGGSGIMVPKNGSVHLSLIADVAQFSSGGATSNSIHSFSIADNADVVAGPGANGTLSSDVTGAPATANNMTVTRTKVTLAAATTGASSGRPRVANDDIATITFSANAAYQALLGTVTIKFQGLAISSGSTAFNVDFIDTNTNITLGQSATATQSCNPTSGNSCSVTFSPQFTISAGTSVVTKLRVVSSSFFNSTVAGGESISAFINASTDVLFNDGTTAGLTSSISIPFTITNVSYE